MKIMQWFSLGCFILLIILCQSSSAQNQYEYSLHFSESSPLIVDTNQELSIEVSVSVKGKRPDKLVLKVKEFPFFEWWKPERNTRYNTKFIRNKFNIDTHSDLLINSEFGSGSFTLNFIVEVYHEDDILVSSHTEPYKVIIKPAILSTHRVSGGTQNIIKWIDSDELNYAIVNVDENGNKMVVNNLAKMSSKGKDKNTHFTSFDGLTPGQEYKYYIESFTEAGAKITSTPLFVQQDGTPPAPVENMQAASAPQGKIRLTWQYPQQDQISDLAGFFIYREKGVGEIQLVDSVMVTPQSINYGYTDTPNNGLANGAYYSYIVSAFDTVKNTSTGDMTSQQMSDIEIPADAVFCWDTTCYDWKDNDPAQEYKNTGYPILYYRKGIHTAVKINNPNTDISDPTHPAYVDSFRIQWVRDKSHFFDFDDTTNIGLQNRCISAWKSVADFLHGSLIIDSLDFSNNGAVDSLDINGHLYKYAAQFKDKAGNTSEWSRYDQNQQLVGTLQDVFPPEPVQILQAVVETYHNNDSGYVKLQWLATEDPVSGISHFNIHRSLFGKDTIFTVSAATQMFLDTLQYNRFDTAKAGYTQYWILPQDRVGNIGDKSNEMPIELKYKCGPQISYVDNRSKYNDSLHFRLKINYDSEIPVKQYLIFANDHLIGSKPIKPDSIYYLQFPTDGESFEVHVCAEYSDGDMSLNSNELLFTKDNIPPDPAKLTWAVKNDIKSDYMPIQPDYVNFPKVSITSLDHDVDSLFVLRNRENNTEIDTIGRINVPSNLGVPPFSDSTAISLFAYNYSLVMVDSTGNVAKSGILSGYGVNLPFFKIINYDTYAETLRYELRYPKKLFDESYYKIRIYDTWYNPDTLDIETIPDPLFEKTGPKYGGANPDDIDSTSSDSVIIRGTMAGITPKDNGNRHIYYGYATIHLKDDSRYARAGADSCDATFEPDLKQPQVKLIDQPRFGSIYVYWGYLEDHTIQPDTFRVIRDIEGTSASFDTNSCFMDKFQADRQRTITYTIIPGLKLLRGNGFRVYWSEKDASDPVSVEDTRRAFVPFTTFDFKDSTQYVTATDSPGIAAYFKSDSLKVKWEFRENSDDLVNNSCEYIGHVRVQVSNSQNFNQYLELSSSDSADICERKSFTYSDIYNSDILNYPQSGDTLFIRLAAKDRFLNDCLGFWSDTTRIILDLLPPDRPDSIKIYTTFGWTAETNKVNLVIKWKTPQENLSGLAGYKIEFLSLFDVDTTFLLPLDKMMYSSLHLWQPASKDTSLNKLTLINVDISHLDIRNSIGSVKLHIFDKILNERVILIDRFVKTIQHTFGFLIQQIKENGKTVAYELHWNPSESEKFQSYRVNYWDNKDEIGYPGTNDTTVTDNYLKMPAQAFGNVMYFHVGIQYNDCTVSNWSKLDSTNTTGQETQQDMITDIDYGNRNKIPERYQLYQNYPNPFNLSTTIEYDLPETGNITIKIFDISGREVQTLVNENKTAGQYTIIWNGRDTNRSIVPTGVYFIVLQTEHYRSVKKCLLVK